MKISAALKEFLIEIEVRKYTPKTIRSYKNNLNLFLRFCEENIRVTEIQDLQLSAVKKFTLFMTNRGNKGTYINSILKTIKSFVQYCYEEDYGGFNTRKNFKWCKEEKPVILAFKTEDVKAMLRACSGNDYLHIRDRAILTLLFETGVRCWELCCIKAEDIHDDFIIINGKNHKQRVVPITSILKKALIKYDRCREEYFKYRDVDNYYFLSNHGRQLTNSAVEHIIKRYGDGIDGVRVSPHTCRHFFAQQHIRMGTDVYTISRLLGHENIQITQTYLNSLRDEDVINIAKQQSVLQSI